MKKQSFKENSIIDDDFYNLLINKETLDADIANQMSAKTPQELLPFPFYTAKYFD